MNETQIVRAYLTAVRTPPPIDRLSIDSRLRIIDARLARDDLDVLDRLKMIQERIDRVAMLDGARELDALQGEFVKVCKAYSDRMRISFDAWRELGVPSQVLTAAGLRPMPSISQFSRRTSERRRGLPGRVGAERINALADRLANHLREVRRIDVGATEPWYQAIRRSMGASDDETVTASAIQRATQRLLDTGKVRKVMNSPIKVAAIEWVE